jgi:hypothetical protein
MHSKQAGSYQQLGELGETYSSIQRGFARFHVLMYDIYQMFILYSVCKISN